MRKTEAIIIQECLLGIEAKLGWGRSQEWSNQEFEELSELILAATEVSLSTTTLKRVWGRVNYASSPSLTTLNALAVFAGAENWRSFRLQVATNIKLPEPEVQAQKNYFRIGAAVLALLLLTFFIVAVIRPESRAIPPDSAFTFESRSITKGLPNSVVFEYHADAAPFDEIYIQQSWDSRKRVRVPRNGRTHTSQYYEPGYFNAKLLVGDHVVRHHDIYITSDDWVGLIDHSPTPVYLPNRNLISGGSLGSTPDDIRAMNVNLQPNVPVVTFSKVPSDFGGLFSNNFGFSTRIRHGYDTGSAICRFFRLIILLKDDAIIIPLSAPGCIAELNLYFPGQQVDGSQSDLSGLGVFDDTRQWQDLQVVATEGLFNIFTNGQKVFQDQMDDTPKEIVGLRFEFDGSGAVDFLDYQNNQGESVWREDF
ncbi:hypothetical protein CEQ90_12655 [Lewinellaceae bacterium SD302]|nr:hypothetical protein CEQ90_12655 [Lewinellaceae bacterium SD302]